MWSILFEFILLDIRSAIICILFAYSVYYLVKFYLKVINLPPGPLPLPLIGNLHMFRSEQHFIDVLSTVSKKYGSVFTFWLGNNPFVFITDVDIGREAFHKSVFCGRHDTYFGSFLNNNIHEDILFTDYGKTWQALRKVSHSAIIDYSRSDKMAQNIHDNVDYFVKLILQKEGCDHEFCPKNYIIQLFLNQMSITVFGTRYEVDDKEFVKLKHALTDHFEKVRTRVIMWEFSSLARLIDRNMIKKSIEIIENFIDFCNEKLKSHQKVHKECEERDICDALITARNIAIKEGKESTLYLNDNNISVTLFDLFLAGTETSQVTFQWMLLFITYYPEIQQKLREEIECEIGDRIATHKDKNRCHYVMAFIAETLRFRNTAPWGVPHKTLEDSELGGYQIAKGTGIILHDCHILLNEKHWLNAHEFRPERFLENGKYMTTRPKAYIPFGVGRRVCLGEKLAVNELFLILVRLLQSTKDYEILLGDNYGIDVDPKNRAQYAPGNFKIAFRKINL